MKKFLLLVMFAVFTGNAAGFYASVAPEKIGVNTQQNVFVVSVSGCVTDNASFEFLIPQELGAQPDTNAVTPGAVSAAVIRGGITSEEISASQISITGYAVIINGLSLAAADILNLNYGKVDVGAAIYGITAPSHETTLYFGVKYSHDNWAAHVSADEAPELRVVFMDLVKSVSAQSIMAGMTFTYAVTYTNMSPYHYAQNLVIWDSLPQGVEYVSHVSDPIVGVNASGGALVFEAGTLMYQQAGVINITARAVSGIINFGTLSVNRAGLSGNDMYSNTLSAYAEASSQVTGVKFEASLSASPVQAAEGNKITVIMNVKNTGNAAATNLRPGVLSVTPAGAAELISGPEPLLYSYFGIAEMKTFTWVYNAVQTGVLYFTGSVSVVETYSTVEKSGITSNQVSITEAVPTPVETEPTPVAEPEARTDKNYFNPDKNEKVKVSFIAKKPGKAAVKVLNLNGERVREYTVSIPAEGAYFIEWDGKNEAGNTAAKGIYFVVIRQETGTEMVRVAVIK